MTAFLQKKYMKARLAKATSGGRYPTFFFYSDVEIYLFFFVCVNEILLDCFALGRPSDH